MGYAFDSDSVYETIDEVNPPENMCDYDEKVVYPVTGQRQDGTEVYIINTHDHKQGVHISVCRAKGQPCTLSNLYFRNYYRTFCNQNYVVRELLSLTPEGVPVKEKFVFPTSCSCLVRTWNEFNTNSSN